MVYIDTPGFDDTSVPDAVMLSRIADWLHHKYVFQDFTVLNNRRIPSSLTNSIPISGIFYFHRISDNRMSGTAVQNLEVFQKLCGFDNSAFLQRVFFVTTMWDEVEPSEGERRLKELCTSWWSGMMKKGANEHALRGNGSRNDSDGPTPEAVKAVVDAVVDRASSTPSQYLHSSRTSIQSELQQGKEVGNTAAASVLYKQAGKQRRRLKEIVDKLQAEQAAITEDGHLKNMLQKELDDARKELTLVEGEEVRLAEGGARTSKFRFWA